MKRVRYAIGALWRRYRKPIVGVLTGATGAGVAAVVAWMGVDLNPGPGEGIDPGVATVIAFGLQTLGTIFAKPNALVPNTTYEVETGQGQPNLDVTVDEANVATVQPQTDETG